MADSGQRTLRMAGVVLLLSAVCYPLSVHAQTKIASDIEIRRMEAMTNRREFDVRVAAHVNIAELRRERNEPAEAQREFETALAIAQKERDDARHAQSVPRYALACGWAGIALAGLNRGAEAFAVLEEGVRYASESAGLWNLYSVAMFRLHKMDKAVGTGRISVAGGEGKVAEQPTVRNVLSLNVERLALAQALIDSSKEEEAETILRKVTASLDSDQLAELRKSLGREEDFQVVTAAMTENGTFLTSFNRAHTRLGEMYEKRGAVEKAQAEYRAVLTRRTDEPVALAGMARLASDPKEKDRWLIASLDANPFALDVITDYEAFLDTGKASPATGDSAGTRMRLALRQMHDHDFRRARATLQALLDAHPDNDVLQGLIKSTQITSRPWFLTAPEKTVSDPTEWDLRDVLGLLAGNDLSPDDLATLDKTEFTSDATFDGDTFEQGMLQHVPFRFQNAVKFKGVDAAAKQLRITYRIVGATTVNDRDALLVEPIRAEAGK